MIPRHIFHLLAPRFGDVLVDKGGGEHGVLVAEIAFGFLVPGTIAADSSPQHKFSYIM